MVTIFVRTPRELLWWFVGSLLPSAFLTLFYISSFLFTLLPKIVNKVSLICIVVCAYIISSSVDSPGATKYNDRKETVTLLFISCVTWKIRSARTRSVVRFASCDHQGEESRRFLAQFLPWNVSATTFWDCYNSFRPCSLDKSWSSYKDVSTKYPHSRSRIVAVSGWRGNDCV